MSVEIVLILNTTRRNGDFIATEQGRNGGKGFSRWKFNKRKRGVGEILVNRTSTGLLLKTGQAD